MELIPIREAARRLGVSDTALHKARRDGRIVVHPEDAHPQNGRPRLRWPDVQRDYLANSDHEHRTHVGSRGSPRRPADAPPAAPSREPLDAAVGGDALPGRAVQGPSLAQSKAVREAYLARLAKLEYEREIGKVVDADQVKMKAFNAARAARDALLTMPDRLAPLLAGTNDVLEVRRLLDEDIAMVCARIADTAAGMSTA